MVNKENKMFSVPPSAVSNDTKGKGLPPFSVPPSLTGKGVRGLGSSFSSLAKLVIRTLTRRIEDDASTSPCQGEAIISSLKVLTGAQRRILLCVDTGEARNPWWVSHPNLLFFSFAASLSFCACAPVAAPAPRPVMVEVPIATPIYCQVPKLQPPILAIADLTPDSPPADTVRSYAASVDVLKSAVHERDTILEACAPPAGASAPPNAVPQPSTPASASKPPPLSKDDTKAAPDVPSRLVSTFCAIVSWPKYLFSAEKQIK